MAVFSLPSPPPNKDVVFSLPLLSVQAWVLVTFPKLSEHESYPLALVTLAGFTGVKTQKPLASHRSPNLVTCPPPIPLKKQKKHLLLPKLHGYYFRSFFPSVGLLTIPVVGKWLGKKEPVDVPRFFFFFFFLTPSDWPRFYAMKPRHLLYTPFPPRWHLWLALAGVILLPHRTQF